MDKVRVKEVLATYINLFTNVSEQFFQENVSAYPYCLIIISAMCYDIPRQINMKMWIDR